MSVVTCRGQGVTHSRTHSIKALALASAVTGSRSVLDPAAWKGRVTSSDISLDSGIPAPFRRPSDSSESQSAIGYTPYSDDERARTGALPPPRPRAGPPRALTRASRSDATVRSMHTVCADFAAAATPPHTPEMRRRAPITPMHLNHQVHLLVLARHLRLRDHAEMTARSCGEITARSCGKITARSRRDHGEITARSCGEIIRGGWNGMMTCM